MFGIKGQKLSTEESKSIAPCFVITSAVFGGWRLSSVYLCTWYDHLVSFLSI